MLFDSLHLFLLTSFYSVSVHFPKLLLSNSYFAANFVYNQSCKRCMICLNKIVFSFRFWACRILLNKQPSSCQRDLSEPKKNYINIRNISHCENNWYNRHPALLTGSSRITNKIGYDTFIITEKTIFLWNVHSPGVYCVLVSIDTRFIYLDDCSLST